MVRVSGMWRLRAQKSGSAKPSTEQGTMPSPTLVSATDYLMRSRDAIQAAIGDPAFIGTVAAVADRIATALITGRKVLLAGNGGSAGDAQHIAGEFL